ncbi:MAG: response regulator [Chloroflexi bacterium]|nr:response regulator [Chloroflexota bacterium]
MKILIAEDNAISRLLLRKILSGQRHYEVLEAANGLVAWDLLKQGPLPDLCILDIMMPELGGLELLKKMRGDERLKGLKVILCSALNDRQTVTQAAALGIRHYIIKPYTAEFVLQQVEQALGQSKLEVLEEPERICRRLSINELNLAHLLEMLVDEVKQGMLTIRNDLVKGNSASAVSQLNALKGACANLGAIALQAKLGKAEEALRRSDYLPPNWPELASSDAPANTVFASHVQYLFGLLDQIEEEHKRLVDCIPKPSAQLATAE